MTKIVLVLPTLQRGGAERVMSELANEWSADGHQVQMILLVKGANLFKLNSAVEVINLDYDLNNRGIAMAWESLKMLLCLRKHIKANQPKFVLSFMHKYNIVTLLATAFLQVKVFVSDRDNPKAVVPHKIEFLRSLLYGRAAGIIAQTTLAKEILCRKTKNSNIKVIPNPIRNVPKLCYKDNHKIIINIGRLDPDKGQHYLVSMMKNLNRENWKLIILGDGPLRGQLQTTIDKFNLNASVELVGSVENVDEWLQKSSIFVLSSNSEGFPNALAEAMASGVPSVSFDCDAGPRDIIINNMNGLLVPLNDAESLKEAVQKLIDDEELRKTIGEQGRQINEKLNIKKIAQEYFEFCSLNKEKCD